jgi:hypothetical protein
MMGSSREAQSFHQGWIQGNQAARNAYLMEIQAQSQINQRSTGSTPVNQWFA